MRHPGFMAAFADRMGDLDDLSGFIIIFLICTVITCYWNDFSRRSHPQPQAALQDEHLPQTNRRMPETDQRNGDITD